MSFMYVFCHVYIYFIFFYFTGDKETVQDLTKFLMGSNVSLESNMTKKKTDSGKINYEDPVTVPHK